MKNQEPTLRGVGTDFRLDPKLEGNNSYEVAKWLESLVGKENLEQVSKWLAFSLDFSNPICVLSIESFPGTGKSLLVKALASCLETPYVCRGSEFVSDNSEWVVKTPIINIDSGCPSAINDREGRTLHTADFIRKWTGGGIAILFRDGRAPERVVNPCRIILTSNSSNLVDEILFNGRELSPEDLKAMNDRVLHIKAPANFPNYNPPSKEEIASHIKYLYDNRERLFGKPGCRYSVSGLEGGEQFKPSVDSILKQEMTLKTLQKETHRIAIEKGWWEKKERNFGEICSLFHSEVSEAFEAYRQGNPPSKHIPEFSGIEEELADVIIRIADYAESAGIDLEAVIKAKIKYNTGRSYRHGNKVC